MGGGKQRRVLGDKWGSETEAKMTGYRGGQREMDRDRRTSGPEPEPGVVKGRLSAIHPGPGFLIKSGSGSGFDSDLILRSRVRVGFHA